MGPEDALMLVAHGSARYPDAGRVALEQLARIRQAEPSREVALGLLNGAPSVSDALDKLTAACVRVVPWFMEDGYFTQTAVPRALGITKPNGTGRLRLCPPVGLHDDMAALIAHHVLTGCQARNVEPEATSVLVVGHGSARAPGRALALYRHVSTVRALSRFAKVEAACLEEAPFIASVLRALQRDTVAVVGFFAGEGGHVRDDVPDAIAAEQALRGPGGAPVHNYGSVMDSPGMIPIILAQAKAAGAKQG